INYRRVRRTLPLKWSTIAGTVKGLRSIPMQRARPGNPDDIRDQKALALTNGALECARALGLSPADTATLLGVNSGALQAMKAGKRQLDGTSGEAERADALVRVVLRLRKLLGDSETNWRSWIRRESAELQAKPIDVMLRRDGAAAV